MLAERIKLERTAVDRWLRRAPPVLVLDRDQPFMAASRPLPQAYQSGLPAEFFAQIDGIVGQYPLGPMFPRYARALRAGIVEADDLPGLDWKPASGAKAVPVLAIANGARHTNFSLEVAASTDTPILPADRWCTYVLVVNTGANAASIGLDKSSIGGLPLAAGGGFWEAQFGTKSEVRVTGVGGATTIHVVVGRASPAEACALDCAKAS
jgi:hypothetical protein